ncbi:MAG: hypothetical protein NVS9B4_17860 [Candidatus Acidiferrum sp.]
MLTAGKMTCNKLRKANLVDHTRRFRFVFGAVVFVAALATGCGQDASKPSQQTPSKAAAPAIPDEMQEAAKALLGNETQVLLFGDLAKTGTQQFLAANVVPKTPTNNVPGTVVTRAVVAEQIEGKWTELLHCDEYLKNSKGFLALTPLTPVSGWRLQYEQNPEKGLQLYFTPVKTNDAHVQPVGIGWNPKVKRYQSLDRGFQHFLGESSSLGGMPRSSIR